MKIVIFGLTISSTWGNGHATLWRGLCRALARRGHRITFFERDVSYYAGARDCYAIPGGDLVLYGDWQGIVWRAVQELGDADVGIVTSYCPDGIAASELVLAAPHALAVFYDLDTPVTLGRLARGEALPYIGAAGLRDFALVLSYTGGKAIEQLRARLGARRVMPMYGHVDPEVHQPAAAVARYRADLSYLGTFAADRQDALEALFIEPARGLPHKRFLIGGAQYPQDFPWSNNIFFVRHLPASEHPAFFSSSRLTLNITRRDMATMGWCPSGRLFEAAACGGCVVSDSWDGLEQFFRPDAEILVAREPRDIVSALELSDAEIARIGTAARERAVAEHTSEHRAQELLASFELPTDRCAERQPEPIEA
jgi:spore maturation protein CgeB